MNELPTCPACPLCDHLKSEFFDEDKIRRYFRCKQCYLVFVLPSFHLSKNDEKAIYDFHDNDLEDIGYKQFLSRMALPLSKLLAPNSTGLDFGCGPAPLLAKIMKEMGHKVTTYDPYYFPEEDRLKQIYDFVTATEVVEHFNHPKADVERLISLVKEGGLLGIMTKRVIDQSAFHNWHYKRDPTHVSFFSDETFDFLAQRYSLHPLLLEKDVVIFQKK